MTGLSLKHGRFYRVFYKITAFIIRLILRILFRVEIEGLEKIPAKGRIILCCNHMSYIDPVIICIFLPRYIYFMAKSEVFENKFLRSFFTFFNAFPVKRYTADISAIHTSVKVLRHDNAMALFPEGVRHVDGIIGEGLKGISIIAHKSETPIIPMAISGANRIVRLPRKMIYFPKIKLKIGELIDTEKIFRENERKAAIHIVLDETMTSIKELYNKIK